MQALGLVRISKNMKSTVSKSEGELDGTWADPSTSQQYGAEGGGASIWPSFFGREA